jgi:Zn-finger protein
MPPSRAILKVTCPRDGDVLVQAGTAVIDDEDGTYRFTCSACALPVEKPTNDDIRRILRTVGVPTIDELCEAFASLLGDDRNIVRTLLSDV